jgi:hypothetical protein
VTRNPTKVDFAENVRAASCDITHGWTNPKGRRIRFPTHKLFRSVSALDLIIFGTEKEIKTSRDAGSWAKNFQLRV